MEQEQALRSSLPPPVEATADLPPAPPPPLATGPENSLPPPAAIPVNPLSVPVHQLPPPILEEMPHTLATQPLQAGVMVKIYGNKTKHQNAANSASDPNTQRATTLTHRFPLSATLFDIAQAFEAENNTRDATKFTLFSKLPCIMNDTLYMKQQTVFTQATPAFWSMTLHEVLSDREIQKAEVFLQAHVYTEDFFTASNLNPEILNRPVSVYGYTDAQTVMNQPGVPNKTIALCVADVDADHGFRLCLLQKQPGVNTPKITMHPLWHYDFENITDDASFPRFEHFAHTTQLQLVENKLTGDVTSDLSHLDDVNEQLARLNPNIVLNALLTHNHFADALVFTYFVLTHPQLDAAFDRGVIVNALKNTPALKTAAMTLLENTLKLSPIEKNVAYQRLCEIFVTLSRELGDDAFQWLNDHFIETAVGSTLLKVAIGNATLPLLIQLIPARTLFEVQHLNCVNLLGQFAVLNDQITVLQAYFKHAPIATVLMHAKYLKSTKAQKKFGKALRAFIFDGKSWEDVIAACELKHLYASYPNLKLQSLGPSLTTTPTAADIAPFISWLNDSTPDALRPFGFEIISANDCATPLNEHFERKGLARKLTKHPFTRTATASDDWKKTIHYASTLFALTQCNTKHEMTAVLRAAAQALPHIRDQVSKTSAGQKWQQNLSDYQKGFKQILTHFYLPEHVLKEIANTWDKKVLPVDANTNPQYRYYQFAKAFLIEDTLQVLTLNQRLCLINFTAALFMLVEGAKHTDPANLAAEGKYAKIQALLDACIAGPSNTFNENIVLLDLAPFNQLMDILYGEATPFPGTFIPLPIKHYPMFNPEPTPEHFEFLTVVQTLLTECKKNNSELFNLTRTTETLGAN